MSNHRRPFGQHFSGGLGYRLALSWRDRLRVLMGRPLTLVVTISTPMRVPTIRSKALMLVDGKPCHNGSRLELLDPEKPDAPAA